MSYYIKSPSMLKMTRSRPSVAFVPNVFPKGKLKGSPKGEFLSKSLKVLVAGEGLEPPTRGL